MQLEEVLGLSEPKEDLGKLVDPRLGENYPIDSVFKVLPSSFSNLILLTSKLKMSSTLVKQMAELILNSFLTS